MARTTETESSSDDKKKRSNLDDTRNSTATPTPRSLPLFSFLESLFFPDTFDSDEEEGFPQKIALHAAYGSQGQRLGPNVKEVSFPPSANKKPTKLQLVELSNRLLDAANADCNVLRRATTYTIVAYDFQRSDKYYARHLIRLTPSNETTALDDERGGGSFDDDENGVLPTKLLLQILDGERRDKRWMAELMANTISGALERDAERIEKMETLLDGSFKQRVEYLRATEDMLNQAADRKAKSDWQKWKTEKLNLMLDKAVGLSEIMLPKLLEPRGQVPAAVGDNPVLTFLRGMSNDQGVAAFGQPTDDGATVTGALFTPEQFAMLVKLSNAPDDRATLAALVSSVRPDQLAGAQQIFEIGQLMPLMEFLQSKAPNATSGLQ